MTQVTTELLFIFCLLLANGVFALAEIAILSARKARLQQAMEQGNAGARAALALANSPGGFLSTVQVGITLVGILMGAFSGATIADVLTERFQAVPALAPYARSASIGLVVVFTTYLSVVVGELVPKRIGLSDPERIAAAVAGPMQWLSRLATPLVWVLEKSSEGLLRLFGIRAAVELPVTEEELKVLIEQGTEAGVFEAAERELLGRVLQLGDRRVGSLVVPRTEMVWFDLHESPESIRRKISRGNYSRFPVCDGSPDEIRGVVTTHDLLVPCLAGEVLDLAAVLQPPLFVPETLRAFRLLELFRDTGNQFAVVLDEHGGTHGIVTPTDILEAIVGEIPELGERAESQVMQRDDGSWLVDGSLSFDEFARHFRLPASLEGAARGFETLGGFFGSRLGRIPTTGEHVELGDLRLEVVDMDGYRVDKVLVTRLESGS
jgi:putative hemolysin